MKNNSKKLLSVYCSLSSNGISDADIVNRLVKVLESGTFNNDLTLSILINKQKTESNEIKYIDIIELIGIAHQKKKGKQAFSNTDERKHNGIYYTNYLIAKLITKETLSLYRVKANPLKIKFLEPCSGIGIFALAYLDFFFKEKKYSNKDAQLVINNMFFADIDKEAVNLLKLIIPLYLRRKYDYKIYVPSKNLFVGDLLFTNTKNGISKNNPREIFKEKDGFDIVLTNPPYKLLKANSNKYDPKNSSYKAQVDMLLKYIRSHNIYKYNRGTLNLYKLFVEEIIENYTKANGKVGILIPSALLSDKQSYELRNHILYNYKLSPIYLIPEKNNFFLDICQAFCFFSIDKELKSTDLKIITDVTDVKGFNSKPVRINKGSIAKISNLQEVIPTNNMGWRVLAKIHKNKKLKEITSILNLRGELDLTLDKKYITSTKTSYPLLKGKSIKEYLFIKNGEFVKNNFLHKLNGKREFVYSERIVCQQISNIHSNKRLKFSIVPKGFVLGNSCNFVAINSKTLFSQDNISLKYLLGLLNSLLLNWRFQKTSSNNHIGNYELDELPIKEPSNKQRLMIESLVENLINNPENKQAKAELNKIVFNLYELNKEEAFFILDEQKKSELANLVKKYLERSL